MNKKFLLMLLGFFVVGFILYLPGIGASRYGDDFSIVPEGNLKSDLVKIWTTAYQREMFFRPIDDTITTSIIYLFGYNTVPVHLFILLCHALFVTFSFFVMLKLKIPRYAALFGAIFILIAQVNAFSVGSNDTIGTMTSCLFCLTSLWFLYEYIQAADNKSGRNKYALSILLFTLSLFCKEASVTFFPLLCVLMLYNNSFFRPFSFAKLKKSIIVSLPFVLIFIVYFIIHSKIVPVQPATGSGNYDFRFGMNVPKNIGMMLFSIFLPVSSVRTFEAVELRNYKFLSVALLLTIVFAGIIFYGIWKSGKLKGAAMWMCFLVAGFFPVALMNHVNEQYTYFSMPFVAMIIASGAGYYWDKPKGWSRTIALSLLVVFLLTNSLSVFEKSTQMKETGDRADILFEQINNYLPQVEHGGSLVLVNPPGWQLKYSVFRLPGFETMRYAQFYIYKLAGRNDFKVEVIDWKDIESWKKPNTLFLKLDGDKVLRME